MMSQERKEIKESRDLKSSDRDKNNISVNRCTRKNRAIERELPMRLVFFLKVESKLLRIFGIRPITGQNIFRETFKQISRNMKMCGKCTYTDIK